MSMEIPRKVSVFCQMPSWVPPSVLTANWTVLTKMYTKVCVVAFRILCLHMFCLSPKYSVTVLYVRLNVQDKLPTCPVLSDILILWHWWVLSFLLFPLPSQVLVHTHCVHIIFLNGFGQTAPLKIVEYLVGVSRAFCSACFSKENGPEKIQE